MASFMGAHRFDNRWPDWSPQGISARAAQIRGQLAELEKLVPLSLSTDDKVDLEVIRDALQLELLELIEIKGFTWDPPINDSLPPYDPREVVADRLVGLVRGAQGRAAAQPDAATGAAAGVPQAAAGAAAAAGAGVHRERHHG